MPTLHVAWVAWSMRSCNMSVFLQIVNGQFAKFLDLSKSIGGEVAEQVRSPDREGNESLPYA